MNRACVLLAALLVLPVAAARPHHEDDTARETEMERDALRERAPLVVTLSFGMPALRGHADIVSILHVKSPENQTWSGVWWATSEAGASTPLRITIDAAGAFVDHRTNAAVRLPGDVLHVRYHFLSLGGRAWNYGAPSLPVLDAAPLRDAPILAGASADADLIAFAPWNVMPRDADMGFTLRSARGEILRDERIGACADPENNLTESGCRVPYVLQRQGTTLELWDVVGGARRIDERFSIDALSRQAYVFHA